MRRSSAVKWSLVILIGLLVIAGALWIAMSSRNGESPNIDQSIELFDPFRASEIVENGSAYDRAVVDLGSAKRIVLPNDAVVRRTGKSEKVQLFVKKTLAYAGHPGEPMSIREARNNMGCAVKVEGDTLVVATVGEWDSFIEGGGHIRLVAVVPEGVELELRKGLSGPTSDGQEWDRKRPPGLRGMRGVASYKPVSLEKGWTAVPDVPDPNRTTAADAGRVQQKAGE
jgi:hypothetical protein